MLEFDQTDETMYLEEVLNDEETRFMKERFRPGPEGHGNSLSLNLKVLITRPKKKSKNKKRLKKDGKLSKPPNEWILFNRNHSAKVANYERASIEQVNGERTAVQNVRKASYEWKRLDPEHKRFYKLLAKIAKFVHIRKPSEEEISQWVESIGYKPPEPPDNSESYNGGQTYVGTSRSAPPMVLTTSVDGMNPGSGYNNSQRPLQGHSEFTIATSPNSLMTSTDSDRQHREQGNILDPFVANPEPHPEPHPESVVAGSLALTVVVPAVQDTRSYNPLVSTEEGRNRFVEGLALPTGENATSSSLATTSVEQHSFDGYVKGLELDHTKFSADLPELF